MIPTLEDVARITGLRVDGQAVTGVTYTSYQEQVERLLGLKVTRERSSLVWRTGLQHWRFYRDERSLRRQVTLIHDALDTIPFGHVLWAPYVREDDAAQPWVERGRPYFNRDIWLHSFNTVVPLHHRLVARTLGLHQAVVEFPTRQRPWERPGRSFRGIQQVTDWTVRVHEQLEDWEQRGTEHWRFYRDERSLRRQVTLIHDALDTIPFGHVQWAPYVREDDAAQPWVERGRPYFSRDIWLHSFNTVVPLHHRLVARTLGLHQAVVEFPTRQRPWERPGRSFRGIQQVTDWTVWVREQLEDWEQRGTEVTSEATSDEDYFRAYAQRYGAQVYKGYRRPFDPEGCIASLEGILHSTIQQRDDLQVVVTQLWEELDRAQQMAGGASSSREDPGCSMLEGQLVAVVARAEDALAQEAEERDSLARTSTLEAEMAKLRLRPDAVEVSRWRQEAEEATRWRQEAEEATRWRTEVGDLCTQLGEERHRCELLRFEMKGLERALALV
ncbi:hypothetical protein Taro_009466 [Colocasia esculenta]|uniref:Uncharacterized protein n=1 Tax=Colocasia esculenta TaxID=4460 RepID=A0A843TWG1_COLES|nr:hypothetical protein [Colocasia esculenta]